MRSIEEAVKDIKYGNVLTIMNNSLKEDNYSACLTEYDGKIMLDVKEVELGNFLEQIPNIKTKINGSDYYEIKYDLEKQKYQSSIMHKVRQGGYKEPIIDKVLDNLTTENYSLIEGMLDLDTKIANTIINENKKSIKKILIS